MPDRAFPNLTKPRPKRRRPLSQMPAAFEERTEQLVTVGANVAAGEALAIIVARLDSQ